MKGFYKCIDVNVILEKSPITIVIRVEPKYLTKDSARGVTDCNPPTVQYTIEINICLMLLCSSHILVHDAP